MPIKEKKHNKKKEIPQKKRLVLLDAHAIIHRAYHALPDFSTSGGVPTGGLYGVAAMLIKIINELKPDYMAACYDLPEPTFRHEAYDDYKAGRAKADDNLISQINRSRDIFGSFNIPIYEKAGFEADDILGTIVEILKGEDIDIVIASGDMDTLQLVNDKKVQVYTLRKGLSDTIIYDQNRVKERFGFLPVLLPDFKGLRGDPSDNIIGIVGIGEKTATTLIQSFGSVENIYTKLKKNEEAFTKAGIKPRIVGLLKEGEEEAYFSKTLATIRRDAPIKFRVPKKTWEQSFDLKKIEDLFAELEFRALLSRVKQMFGNNQQPTTNNQQQEQQEIDEKLLKETALALWVLKSDITTPELEDILGYAKTDNLKDANSKIMSDLKKQGTESIYKDIMDISNLTRISTAKKGRASATFFYFDIIYPHICSTCFYMDTEPICVVYP